MNRMRTLASCPANGPWTGFASPGRAVARTCRPFCSHQAVSRPHIVPRSTIQQVFSTRLATLHIVKAGQQDGSAFDFDEPDTAREAIDLGLVLCKQDKWETALEVFEKALTLPGTGVKRYRDKPRLISDGEKMAALYNIACCHAQLQDAPQRACRAFGCMELGYTDWNQIRIDPDLEFLRQDSRFEGLMERFQKKSGGFFGMDLSGIFGNK